MLRNAVISFDNKAISRARELRAQARALRQPSRTLMRRIHADHAVLRGLSDSMLMEIA